ncbi:MAG TPA: PmoA family protein [Planctomicrobium sp.]|nr:PmoA family protein [Planctomicrobium sp.]
MFRAITAVTALFLWSTFASAAEPQVTLQKESAGVKVLIGDDVFAVYRFGQERRKPFFYPVTAAGGFDRLKQAVSSDPAEAESRQVVVVSEKAILTDGKSKTGEAVPFGTVLSVEKVDGNKVQIAGGNGWLNRSDIVPVASTVVRLIQDEPNVNKDRKSPNFYDHPHHKGIWFGVDEINDIKYWMEGSLVVAKSVDIVKASGDTAQFKVVNEWLDLENKPVLEEHTLITISNDRLISYEATLKAAAENVHIGDTKEGFFAIRMANTMPERLAGGPVINADGLEGSKAAWGKTSRWLDYVGEVSGQKYGVTMMDSSNNPWESRYHVRDYGLLSVNPFGAGAYTEKTPDAQPKHARDLKKGDSIQFQYGLWVHNGVVDKDAIEKEYAKFLKLSDSK